MIRLIAAGVCAEHVAGQGDRRQVLHALGEGAVHHLGAGRYAAVLALDPITGSRFVTTSHGACISLSCAEDGYKQIQQPACITHLRAEFLDGRQSA